MVLHDALQQLKSIKLSEVRKVISQECYRRCAWRAILWFAIDFCLFSIGMLLIFMFDSTWLKLAGSLIAGVATAMMFVWAHDAAHGTLFKNSKIAEIMGTIFMLPALSIFRLWVYGHNKVHHGFTSFTPIDWIWRPLTPQEYFCLSRWQRILYRIERNFLSCAFHYLRRVWWNAMLRFNPGTNKKERSRYRFGKAYVLSYAVIMSVISYFFAGGLLGVVCAVIIPFIVFNYFISLIVYLHHTHPDIPFFDIKKEWSHSIGLLYCSTIVHCSKISEMLLHNIMIHVPHHVDIRIPFYHLKRAFRDLKQHYSHYMHEYRFRWHGVASIFRACKLYDFDNNRWLTFREAAKTMQVSTEAATAEVQ